MTVMERYESRIEPEPNSGCWLWVGVKTPLGYGVMNKKGPNRNSKRKIFAHRVSYELFVGPIPPGLYVLHRCDMTACSNPRHLFLGTQRDNVLDAKAKRRLARGERNGMARLSQTEADAIRATTGPALAVASRYGVSDSAVYMIRNGRRWAS